MSPSLPRRGSLGGGIWGCSSEQRAVQNWATLSDAQAVLAALLPACWDLPRHPTEKTSGEGAHTALIFQPYCAGEGGMPKFGVQVAGTEGTV